MIHFLEGLPSGHIRLGGADTVWWHMGLPQPKASEAFDNNLDLTTECSSYTFLRPWKGAMWILSSHFPSSPLYFLPIIYSPQMGN